MYRHIAVPRAHLVPSVVAFFPSSPPPFTFVARCFRFLCVCVCACVWCKDVRFSSDCLSHYRFVSLLDFKCVSCIYLVLYIYIHIISIIPS